MTNVKKGENNMTIYEVLLNAQYNLCEAKIPFQIEMGKQQLNNAIEQIDNGKTLEDEFEEEK